MQIGGLRKSAHDFLRKLAAKSKASAKSALIAAAMAATFGSGVATPAIAGVLQCVPYARSVSNIQIHGNAKTWWGQAEGVYRRGNKPEVGAVLAFQASRAMPYGHVATVAKIVDDRTLLLNHANWSRPGMIERAALAVDVSERGDWSSVRVWFAPTRSLGTRTNPTFGFIYDDAAGSAPMIDIPATTLAAAGTTTIALPNGG